MSYLDHPALSNRTARFWTFWRGGFVRLRLRPGQSITLRDAAQTDEGFAACAETYRHDGDIVTCAMATWGRDCDGRHEWSADFECEISRLGDQRIDPMKEGEQPSVYTPAWRKIGSGQRDYTAEACGY